ncbi:hypothetical protein LCGC14_2812620 [marine sediment metagenome]|uniref:Uncharacterized protein n=1 Tax=marine sediment metagenome TaxID=412755 RepID=A0A0F8YJF4_9ZZZZ
MSTKLRNVNGVIQRESEFGFMEIEQSKDFRCGKCDGIDVPKHSPRCVARPLEDQNTILKAENKRLREALEPWAEIARKHLREHPYGEYRLHDDPLWDCHALLVAQMILEERR